MLLMNVRFCRCLQKVSFSPRNSSFEQERFCKREKERDGHNVIVTVSFFLTLAETLLLAFSHTLVFLISIFRALSLPVCAL